MVSESEHSFNGSLISLQEIVQGNTPGILFIPSIVKTPVDYIGAFQASKRTIIGLNISSYGELVSRREEELDRITEILLKSPEVNKLVSFSSGAGICLDIADKLGMNGEQVVLVAPVILSLKGLKIVESFMGGVRLSDERAIALIKSIPFNAISELSGLIENKGRLTRSEERVQRVVLEVIKSELGPRLIEKLKRVEPVILAGSSDKIVRVPDGFNYVKFDGGHSMVHAMDTMGEVILS